MTTFRVFQSLVASFSGVFRARAHQQGTVLQLRALLGLQTSWARASAATISHRSRPCKLVLVRCALAHLQGTALQLHALLGLQTSWMVASAATTSPRSRPFKLGPAHPALAHHSRTVLRLRALLALNKSRTLSTGPPFAVLVHRLCAQHQALWQVMLS